jgi:hypothetical protein
MLTAVGSAEGEASVRIAPLGDDAVVVVECLFYGNKDADVGLGLVGLGCVVPCFSVVVAWCVLAVGKSATSPSQKNHRWECVVPTTSVSLGNSS